MLISLGVLALMLWEPHLEGRNVNATLFEIYFKDPFLACAYIASVPFFVALYQAFTLLKRVRQDTIFSLDSVRALRTIKYCAISLIASIAAAEAYFFIFQRGKEDIAGGVAVGLLLMFISAIIAATADVFERLLQSAVDMKSKTV